MYMYIYHMYSMTPVNIKQSSHHILVWIFTIYCTFWVWQTKEGIWLPCIEAADVGAVELVVVAGEGEEGEELLCVEAGAQGFGRGWLFSVPCRALGAPELSEKELFAFMLIMLNKGTR